MKSIVASAFADEVAFLKALVRVPSDNPPGDCGPHAEVAADLLEKMGFAVERHPVPEPFVRQHGMRSVTNLVVRHVFGSGKGPVIALNAHGDVVPPGEGWTADPYGAEERGGAIYGRGVAVSKSDFATYAFALKALIASGLPLDGTIELHFTYDEEAGGFVGPKWLIEQGLSKPDLAISAGFSYAITTAHNGVLHLEVVVRGRQAHAAMPETGVDALEATWPILKAIYEERARLAGTMSAQKGIGSPKVTVGLISGGINTNVVPDRIVLRLDRRLIPEEVGTEVEAALIALIEAAAPKLPGLEVECRRIMLAEPLRPLPGVEPMIESLERHAADVLGVAVAPTGVPLYTDARHYAAAGVPTILYGAGPRSILEANAHAADEHLQLSDLKAATEVVALTLADLLKAD
ncbi:ArgE/DapE family deacylase [Oharaeibacter diazotrophicus]|uniref:Probable succinyl-diaminopimelate desuccinylase n=1 Tax=Oharaeibacter diazotrophicus TaxID=1920512 RepID=A0A4R6RLJ6_9HYPH|nr:ArgE/DapE family deacylase [Oharaeibacter diazotrophicus]TDP86985.1 acetylornithine deacetylase/succinyl-diaminopimelate desuccinylase family protein [Oharaeibacter diazotrophicus]BBE71072.1 acetylornithine deacetylase [Pleomorphomonas sp. SM30]GLS77823.1 succinyl-diaminopimelate desuccinylase [Oharaeibacter diazotrophicus]